MKGKLLKCITAVALALAMSVGVPFTPFHGLLDDMAITASAKTESLQLQQDGSEWYVNMPAAVEIIKKPTEYTLTLNDANVTTFKIYDDGGKNGNYTSNMTTAGSGRVPLTITVPEGYVVQLTGSVDLQTYYGDELSIYDGPSMNDTALLSPKTGTYNIGTLSSTGNKITLVFDVKHNEDGTKAGFDLTAKLISTNTQYSVNIQNATGGSIATNKSIAKINETVTLTPSPNSGYILTDIQVTDEANSMLQFNGGLWYSESSTATFTMPGSAVNVRPVFSSTDDAYINMPVSSTVNVNIPTSVSSIKVYDDGGKGGNYSDKADGYLVLTAPQGFSLKLTGNVTTEKAMYDDKLTVYDGTTNTATILLDRVASPSNGTAYDIGEIKSSGRSLMLYFHSNKSVNYAGLDLTVELVDNRQPNTITVNNPATGGTVTPSTASAKMGDEVTLNVSPFANYLLSGLTVNYAGDQTLETSGGEWYSGSNTSTFTMPGTAVTVNPTFTNNLTAEGGLTVKMQKAGDITTTIPSGVSSFKVAYNTLITESGTSTLLITAPTGYLVQLTGHAIFAPDVQFNHALFKVYDGNTTGNETLINIQKDNTDRYNSDITPAVTTGQSMLISCESQVDHLNPMGNNYIWDLDLTVTFVKIESHNIIISSTNGSVESDKTTAQPNENVNLTVTPDEGYVLKDISVTDADGAITVTKPAADGHLGDTVYYTATSGYSFTMRSKDVTVTPVFMSVTDFEVIIPSTSSRTFNIPDGTTSFRVRHTTQNEHIGSNFPDIYSQTYYGNGYNGSLLLTAPEGYALNLSGSVKLNDNGDYLDVYDGSTTSAAKQTVYGNGHYYAVAVDITSSTNQMLLYFITDEADGSFAPGLDLRVTLLPLYDISIDDEITGGTVTADKSKAAEGKTVTLTVTPYEGYILDTITVTNSNGTPVTVTDNTFTMPSSDVTVTAEFDSIKITQAMLSLNGDIGVTVGITIPTEYTVEGYHMYITSPRQAAKECDDIASAYDEAYGMYLFSYNVAAKEMTDDIDFTLKNASGETVYTESVSVRKIALSYLSDSSTYDKEIPLVKAMLNYGAYAQEYFGYRTETLANAGYKDDTIDDITAGDLKSYEYNADEASDLPDGVAFESVYLSMETEMRLNMVVENTTGKELTFSVPGGYSVKTSGSGERVTVSVTGIKAENIGDEITVNVSCDGISGHQKYSPLTYAYNRIRNDDREAGISKAMFRYYTEAEKYAATKAE